MDRRRAQRGLALITAMLVVAIVATIAAFLSLGQQLWLRQTQNLVDRSQADSMCRATLDWVAILLARDAKTSKTDHLNEMWAKPLPPLPFEGGSVAVTIGDAQARFNINNIVRGGNQSLADINVFRELLRILDIDPNLTEAVVDFLDTDSETRPNGAEDTEYLASSHPYRAANQALSSIDELRLVKGFTGEMIEKLRPYIVALPEPTPININTVSEVVLAALYPGMPLPVAQQVLQQRSSSPFENPDALQIPPQYIPKVQASSQPAQMRDVKTSYFLVQTDISYGRWRRSTLALIQRAPNANTARVLWHYPLYPRLPRDDADAENKS